MTVQQTRFEGLTDILREGLGSRIDPTAESFLDMFAQDCVFEAPYAPPGFIARIEGRDALERYLMVLPGLIRIDDFFDLRISEMADPDKVVLEFRGSGEGRTGAPYDQKWISVIETRNGKIVHYADYWDPCITLAATGDAVPNPEGEGFTRA
ncbi:nuclear transport factor 2 family protein [uncultured Roseobacter sp.]|uniref:nuclear transport factor 2 family protein n=1 Tax=uncultured Roseobacter sp. TaxID=114847 RepID=UPI002631B9D9|nr:nuclear transport factor 2 family protein [uncultured Roseobacter sp.]